MIIAGIILIVIAVVAAFVQRHQGGKAHAARATETLSCADINTLSTGVSAEVGGGGFHQRCEVVGQAAPGEGGLIKAPHSGADAVWHHSTVTHRYWEMEERVVDGQRQRNRVERDETVSDITSAQPFVVSDGTGSVVISPDGANVDKPERVADRFEPQVTQEQLPSGLAGVLGSFLRAGSQSGTLGFRYQEWIIRPGARLYVHGEVSDATGQVAFAKPSEGRYIISTRSEEQIVGAAERNATIATGVGGVLGVAGLVLVILGLVL
jgi:hypothetical protein